MSKDFEVEKFNKFVSEFNKIKANVLQKTPKSGRKIQEFIDLLIKSYNNILIYVESYFLNLSEVLKRAVQRTILDCRELLVICFCTLKCNIRIPDGENIFELVQSEVMTDPASETDNDNQGKSEILVKSGNNIDSLDRQSENYRMASIEEKTKFVTMCSSIIRENYSGDPLTLNSFIDKIDLIQELTAENLNTCFISFIKSKLDGKAREVLPENITNIDQIKYALRGGVKPDNSKVVAGRLVTLQVKDNNYTEFARNVEELADALQRSLVMEGITKDKAKEMAVEQTVKICRTNARSDMVRTIIASTSFSEPKDVIAKLIVEESTAENERQVLAVRYHRSNQQYNRNNFRNNQFGNNNPSRNNSYGNNRSYRNNSRSNYQGINNFRTNNNRSRGRRYSNTGHTSNTNFQNGHLPAVRTLNEEVPQREELGVSEE